jgi:hypothetical protein
MSQALLKKLAELGKKNNNSACPRQNREYESTLLQQSLLQNFDNNILKVRDFEKIFRMGKIKLMSTTVTFHTIKRPHNFEATKRGKICFLILARSSGM